jgi:hypothetical protein
MYIYRSLAVLGGYGGSSINAVRREAYHWAMHRMNPEYVAADASDLSLPADIRVREEPEDEEEEGEDEHDGGEEDDDGDEGYSE